jgi:hypothetical protein
VVEGHGTQLHDDVALPDHVRDLILEPWRGKVDAELAGDHEDDVVEDLDPDELTTPGRAARECHDLAEGSAASSASTGVAQNPRLCDASAYASQESILISDVSVRCTGHLLAISNNLSRCSSVRGPESEISRPMRSSMPSLVSQSAQSLAWIRECCSRTVTSFSGHPLRRAYSATVIDVQVPSAASSNS